MIRRPAALLLAAAAIALPASADDAPEERIVLFVDDDDDDDDGVPDREQVPTGDAARDVRRVDLGAKRKLFTTEGTAVRAVVGGRGLALSALPRGQTYGAIALQGMQPGRARLGFDGRALQAVVFGIFALDGDGRRIDLARSHASISRSLPRSLSGADAPADSDAVVWGIAGQGATLPTELDLVSTTAEGLRLDALSAVPLAPGPCPGFAPEGSTCAFTPAIRAVADAIDRSHPGSSSRSLRAEVGGRVEVEVLGHGAASLRVGGPRRSALGPIGRLRGTLRLRLVRLSAGGSPPVGGDDAAALAMGREEIRTASALWGQCGIHFGKASELDVAIVDPPPPHLLAVGCDLGLPASGGEVRFRVARRELSVATRAGQAPAEVAARIAETIEAAGFAAIVSPNARISPGALPSVDVLVRHRDGRFVELAPVAAGALSSDPSLDVCLGEVDLADGLSHFTDFDAVAGTVEERTLLKAFDDGDPSTIEVLLIPSFAKSGRIGESFIQTDGSSVRNAVIIDRAGIRAGARSFALAHELGHILLDMPGHPDDFGVDRPSSLMDADAADPTIFGPRRLDVAECERALRQSGPSAPVPLLRPWPLVRERKR